MATKPKNLTDAERHAARLRAKRASPWSREPHCTGIKAQAAFKKLARKS
jgi:hypothetical protein